MTKITEEVIERYAMSYPRIDCCMMSDGSFSDCLHAVTHPFDKIEYIQLRSIESITNEELEKVSQIFNLEGWDSEFITSIVKGYLVNGFKHNILEIENANTVIQAFQYLKLLGIATPTIDAEGNIITVEELVKAGVLKLIK